MSSQVISFVIFSILRGMPKKRNTCTYIAHSYRACLRVHPGALNFARKLQSENNVDRFIYEKLPELHIGLACKRKQVKPLKPPQYQVNHLLKLEFKPVNRGISLQRL